VLLLVDLLIDGQQEMTNEREIETNQYVYKYPYMLVFWGPPDTAKRYLTPNKKGVSLILTTNMGI
jgi:hypothetical protein